MILDLRTRVNVVLGLVMLCQLAPSLPAQSNVSVQTPLGSDSILLVQVGARVPAVLRLPGSAADWSSTLPGAVRAPEKGALEFLEPGRVSLWTGQARQARPSRSYTCDSTSGECTCTDLLDCFIMGRDGVCDPDELTWCYPKRGKCSCVWRRTRR